MPSPVDDLRAAVVAAAGNGDAGARVSLERPKQAGHGDYATNAAMVLAKGRGKAPREVAEELADGLRGALGPALEKVEIAGPGFLNLWLAGEWWASALGAVLDAGDAWGAGEKGTGEKVNVEFVSANPTGPLHVGHARNAAYGDAIARILAFHGDDVTREYYVNDFGTQVQVFGASIAARRRGEEVPEGGYPGEYVDEIARELDGVPDEELAERGVEAMLARIRASLSAFRVEHDRYSSEAALHPAKVERAIEILRERGHVFEADGATWVRTTSFGDDKDRVVWRSSGEHTYFASDIAYHQDKRDRGFERLIDVWGADHHGYVARVKAGFAELGGDADKLELVIMQFVHLVKDGERVAMSKRAGTFETLDDLVQEVGVDAARWFLLNRSHDTTIEFDLDLATKEGRENPVYYVQYAHARLSKIARDATAAPSVEGVSAVEPAERELVRKLLAWPAEAADAAERRAPHKVATYALELAQVFTAFYESCRIFGVPEEPWRLALCEATRTTIASSLGLLGVSAPVEM